jgi:hypothetical protein
MLRYFPVLLIFAAILALPFASHLARQAYGIRAESPINLYTFFPEIEKGEFFTAVSFGVAGCGRTCPAQVGALTALSETRDIPIRSIFMRAVKGDETNLLGFSRGFTELSLKPARLAAVAYSISGRHFAANSEQHDSALYLFSPEGRLIFIYPFLFADPAKIIADIRMFPRG